MELPDEAIKELQKICKEEFNKDISEDEARAMASRLLIFFHQYFLWLETRKK